MRFPFVTAAVAALFLSVSATAQKVQVFGGNSMRACSTLVLFGEGVMAGITVTHGQPEWKAEYDGMLDKLKGKLNRLGKDMWTTLANSVAIEIGGVKVPAGSWVVGLACDNDGKFSLALMDATKAMQSGAMPFGPQNWKPEISCPLTLNKDVAKDAVAKMAMELKADEKEPTKGTFTLAWGKHTLTGALAVHVGK